LTKRAIKPEAFSIDILADSCDGFSGAEIEQAIVAAIYTAAAAQESLSDAHIINELQQTSPLSVVMAEKITELRAWAAERTVLAN